MPFDPNEQGFTNCCVDIAFITANHNTVECVRRLVEFFDHLEAPFSFSVTVVDNDSQDGSREFIKSQRGIQYLQSAENIGYGRAINQGVSATNSKYICVLNTDVILNREALVAPWRFLEGRPEVGVCAPCITYEDGRLQGMVFERSLLSHYSSWFAKLLSRYWKWRIAKATTPVRVEGVAGAFFVIRRSAIPERGLFDEDFFFFHEDTALAHTLKNRGVPCFILPGVRIIHIGGQSRSDSAISLFYESKYLYMKKFYGPSNAKAVYVLERARIFRKWLLYSLCARMTVSERVKSKQHYYSTAWNSKSRVSF